MLSKKSFTTSIRVEKFYFAFLWRLDVLNSASSFAKLHQRYVSGMVVACQRA
jgi:hypothetical protein